MVVTNDEEAVGGGEALVGGEGERDVPHAERVGGVVGVVAPAHLPLHQLLGAPQRRRIRRGRRHFSVRGGVQVAAGSLLLCWSVKLGLLLSQRLLWSGHGYVEVACSF